MIVLDTNVVSEFFRPHPDATVLAWMRTLEEPTAITAITLAELLAGVRSLPEGRRRQQLDSGICAAIGPFRDSRAILAFDSEVAAHYAEILDRRTAAGQPISTADAQIAAICRSVDAACATRHVKDFRGTGVRVVNPWQFSGA